MHTVPSLQYAHLCYINNMDYAQLTRDEYSVNFTDEQFEKLNDLTQEWNNDCEGYYESTFVGGVAHGYCDSGILTDGLSAKDIDTLHKYFTDETIYGDIGIDELEQLVTKLGGKQWETDMNKFCREVSAVLTDEQKLATNAFEAAMSYCWQCCEDE